MTVKPYYSFDDQMKERFGGKVYRLALSASKTCPNRDGTCGTGGCIFCSAGGSGDFAEDVSLDIRTQIERAKQRVSRKLSRNFAGYMAYFQSFTETYGDQEHLISCFREAAAQPEILSLSIATRPDSIEPEMLDALSELNRIKPVYVELGLQTIHEDTAAYINRGYSLPVFEEAFQRLKAAGLAVVVHVIIGLPGEDAERTKQTVRYLSDLVCRPAGEILIEKTENRNPHIDGIKLQLLHVLKDTRLAGLLPENYAKQALTFAEGGDPGTLFLNDGTALPCYNIQNYAELITELISMLPARTAVHRLTGDPPKRLLLMPLWSADKKRVLNTITKCLQEHGRRISGSGPEL